MDLAYYRAHARMLGYKYIAVDKDMSVWGYYLRPHVDTNDSEWMPDRNEDYKDNAQRKLGYTDEKHLVWYEEIYAISET